MMKQRFLKILLILCLGGILTNSGYAVVSSTSQNDLFPSSQLINQKVRFWELVFDHYDHQTAIIHDNRYPEVILDIIDFKKHGPNGEYKRYKARRHLAERYKRRYEIGLKRFAERSIAATEHGKIEQRIYNSYKLNEKAFDSLLDGQVQVRIQFGMKREFKTAFKRALKYLPYMERVFREHNLPIELTRLPFVESMFNIKARSKVGAHGMWQFMPETAKQYMHVDHLIDERYSPYKATQAAAKFLKDNHRLLKSWPLAITAYNHGPTSILNAKKRLRTSDLESIIKYYKVRSFGFAGRNFYAEFLAVNKIFNKYKRHMALQKGVRQYDIHSIKIQKPTSLEQLAQHTPLTPKVILKYNPEIKTSGFQHYLKNPLPTGFEIFFPKHLSKEVFVAVNNIEGHSL